MAHGGSLVRIDGAGTAATLGSSRSSKYSSPLSSPCGHHQHSAAAPARGRRRCATTTVTNVSSSSAGFPTPHIHRKLINHRRPAQHRRRSEKIVVGGGYENIVTAPNPSSRCPVCRESPEAARFVRVVGEWSTYIHHQSSSVSQSHQDTFYTYLRR